MQKSIELKFSHFPTYTDLTSLKCCIIDARDSSKKEKTIYQKSKQPCCKKCKLSTSQKILGSGLGYQKLTTTRLNQKKGKQAYVDDNEKIKGKRKWKNTKNISKYMASRKEIMG